MSIKSIWRLLIVAMFTLATQQAFAVGEGTGNIVGSLENQSGPGYSVNATHDNTGRSRDLAVGTDGGFRFSQLPVGRYVLSVSRNGTVVARDSFSVTLNGTTTARFPLEDSGSVDEITVTASATTYDSYATDSGVVLSEETIDMLPVARNLTAVALLAPGVVLGDSKFGLAGGIGYASFGGSSISENSCYINGLEVTNTSQGLGCGSVPFEFFQQFQVKTGGYSAQYGRTTGGVLNAVTKSGGNEWEFGLGMAWEPDSMYEDGKTSRGNGGLGNGLGGQGTGRVFRDSTDDENNLFEYWATASGPIIKDKLFFYGIVNPRDSDQNFSNYTGAAETNADSEYREISKDGSDNMFWGAKVDWDITDYHRLSAWGYSNRNDGEDTHYAKDPITNEIDFSSTSAFFLRKRGGEAYSGSYTGTYFDVLTISSMVGQIKTQYTNTPENTVDCPRIIDNRAPAPASPFVGCGPGGSFGDNQDKNDQRRMDIEWAVGNHVLRGGLDSQDRKTQHSTAYIGGFRWRYETLAPGANVQGDSGPLFSNNTALPLEYVRSRFFDNSAAGGAFESNLDAYYFEDEWSLMDDQVVLYLGARKDKLKNKGGDGVVFANFNQDWAPRLGASWAPGDGDNKLYTTWGRYYLPVLNNTNFRVSSGVTDQRVYYTYTGADPVDGSPLLTVPVNGTEANSSVVNSDGTGPTKAQFQADEADPFYKEEFILGFERYMTENDKLSLRYVHRKQGETLDDYCGPLANQNYCTLVNPGSGGTWEDADGVVRFHSAEDIKLPQGKNKYDSASLQWDHSGDSTNFSFIYVWSKSKGNFEGAVKSDIQQADAGITQDFDFPALMDGAYGALANDRRHVFKFYGSYRIMDGLTAGWTSSLASGRPMSIFGQGYPDNAADVYGSYGDTFYLFTNTCNNAGGSGAVGPCTGTELQSEKIYDKNDRGAGGRTPWLFNLDASLNYEFQVSKVDMTANLQVFNLLNIQEARSINEHAEIGEGTANEFYRVPFNWQTPRYVRFSLQARF